MVSLYNPLSTQPPDATKGSTSVWSFGDRHLIRVEHGIEEDAWLVVKMRQNAPSGGIAHVIEWCTDTAMKPEVWHIYSVSYECDGPKINLESGRDWDQEDDTPSPLTFWDTMAACRSMSLPWWEPCLACTQAMIEFLPFQLRQIRSEDWQRYPEAGAYEGLVTFEIVPLQDVQTVAQNLVNGLEPVSRIDLCGCPTSERLAVVAEAACQAQSLVTTTIASASRPSLEILLRDGRRPFPLLTSDSAASRLGVSVDTVRRRIRRGNIGSQREQTSQGYRRIDRFDRAEPTDADVARDAPGSPRMNDIARMTRGQGSKCARRGDQRLAR